MYDTVFASIDSDLNRFVIHEILIEKQMKIETKRNDRQKNQRKKNICDEYSYIQGFNLMRKISCLTEYMWLCLAY